MVVAAAISYIFSNGKRILRHVQKYGIGVKRWEK